MKKQIDFISRLLLSILFLLSAFAKTYPSPSVGLENFEMEQLYPMGFSEYGAAIFSRFILTCEFAIGIALILPFYLKQIVLPLAGLLLLLFIFHLTYESLTSGNQGNCGCFGQLIPMTPVQAILKNIFALGLVIVSMKFNEKRDFISLLYFPSVFFTLFTSLLLVSPIEETSPVTKPEYTKFNVLIDTLTKVQSTGEVIKQIRFGLDLDFNGELTGVESLSPLMFHFGMKEDAQKLIVKKNKNDVNMKEHTTEVPIPVKSIFSDYYPGIDNGKKLLCIYNPTCDHCMKVCRDIHNSKLKELENIEICILFKEDKPSRIENFFAQTESNYPYQTIPKSDFLKWLSDRKFSGPPGVVYLWNGNERGRYQFKEGVDLDLKSILSN